MNNNKLEFKLTTKVKSDLKKIFAYGLEEHGEERAFAYQRLLFNLFESFTEFPHMGRSADEFKIGLRRFREQSHHVFYSVHQDHILIERISHVKANIKPDLFE